MAKPDPLAARAYRLVVQGAEKNVARSLREIRRHVDTLERDAGKDRTSSLGEAQNLASDVADLIRHLSALHTLNEVEFLTEESSHE